MHDIHIMNPRTIMQYTRVTKQKYKNMVKQTTPMSWTIDGLHLTSIKDENMVKVSENRG